MQPVRAIPVHWLRVSPYRLRLSRNCGAKNSYDEFHTVPKDTPANDGYRSGGFDELHINENYRQNVWHPEHRGYRINGFDEFRYPDEM